MNHWWQAGGRFFGMADAWMLLPVRRGRLACSEISGFGIEAGLSSL